jgi:hypothetical protein
MKIFEEHVIPCFKKYNSNEFRKKKYWNEACDLILKEKLPTLKEIY